MHKPPCSRSQISINVPVLLLCGLSFLPVARADCFIDNNDVERCDTLSTGARIAIAVSIVVAVIILSILFTISRRRRIMRANQAYVTQSQNQAQYGGSPYPNGGGYYVNTYNAGNQWSGNGAPAYPPPSHGYDPQAGYAPPQFPPNDGSQGPPQYAGYTPPQGPPPGKA